MRFLGGLLLLVTACDPRQLGLSVGQRDADVPPAPLVIDASIAQAPAPAPLPAPVHAAPSCAAYCDHALRCLNSLNPTETASCVSSCEAQHPTPAKLTEMTSMTCAQVVAMMHGGGNTPKPTGACTDCNGCYWEQDMCLYVHGYVATGIKQACKPCCCPGH
jgi:hypothetical protein